MGLPEPPDEKGENEMEWIKDLLKDVITDETLLTEKVAAFNKEFPKYAVPKGEFNSTNGELKETKLKLSETAKLIEELNGKAGLAEEFKTKATEWESKYKEFESQAEERVTNIVKKSAVKDILSGKMAKSAVELLLDKVDYKEIALNDKQAIADADALVNKLRENYADLFIEESANSKDKSNNTKDKPADDDMSNIRRIMGLA